MKKFFALVITLIISYFAAFPIGNWFYKEYTLGSGWIDIGAPGYLDGFTFSYVLFSSIIFSLITERIKIGFYAALPVLVIDLLLGSFNPQLWIDLLLLAAGLGIAWFILFLKRKAASKT